MRSRFNLIIVSLFFLIFATGCSTLNIDSNSKSYLLRQTQKVSTPNSYCYKDNKTGIENCIDYDIEYEKVVKGVFVSRISDNEDCVIGVTGMIDSSVKDAFLVAANNAIEMNCKKTIVVLDSFGGEVDAAIDIGIAVRKNQFNTLFDARQGSNVICASACTLIFIAGVSRVVTENVFQFSSAKMGFHQWQPINNTAGDCSDQGRMRKRLTRYTEVMLSKSAASKFIELTLGVDCNQILRVTPEDLVNFGIANLNKLSY
jgi:ATP-dependent protease ClpP protease subunit